MKKKGVQIISGHGPGQLTLGVPGGAGVLDQVTSECPFQSQICSYIVILCTTITSIILMHKSKTNKNNTSEHDFNFP